MRRVLFLCTVLVLLSSAAAARAADDVDSIIKQLYAPPMEIRGEYDILLGNWVKLFKDNIRSPAAPLIVHRLGGILPLCSDPGLLDEFYADLAKLGVDRGLPNGFIASDAAINHRLNLLRNGDFKEAETLNAYASFAGSVLAIGPFGFNTVSLHDIEFPPEKYFEELTGADGYAGLVEWTLVERDPRRASFDLHRHLHPDQGCFYALYQFKMPGTKGIILSLATDASAKIWFNGSLVKDVDRRKAHLPGIFKLPLPAASGWNRVLVKLSSGKPMFTLKVTDRTGYPLKEIAELRDLKLEPFTGGTPGKVEEIDMGSVDLLAFIKTHAGLHADSPYAALALADVLAAKGLLSDAIREGEHALTLAPDDPHVLHLLGKLYTDAWYLPRNHRINRARELYHMVLESDPEFLPAQLALAVHDHENDRSEEAIKSIRKILTKAPRYYDAHLTMISMLEKLDWDKELILAVREARRMAPRDPRPVLTHARYYQDLNRHDMAFDLYKRVVNLDAADTDALVRYAGYLWDRGERSDAFDLFSRVADLDDSTYNRERMAALNLALGDPVKTMEIYTALSEEHPLVSWYYARLGDLAFELEGEDQAAEWYRKAIDTSPQRHSLREILQDWRKIDDSLFSEFGVEPEAYMKELPGREDYPLASAICTLDQMITRIYADGSSRSETFQIFQILDKDAVEQFGRMPVPGRIQELKVIRPDGQVLVPVDAEGRGVFNMPGLDVGALLVVRYTLFDESSVGRPLQVGRFYFQDVDGTMPFLFSRYVLAAPKGFELYTEQIIPSGYVTERMERDEETVHVFTATKSPVVEREFRMPPEEEAFPNVRFYQTRDWVQLTQQFANALLPGKVLTGEIRAKAEELTGELGTDLEKAHAIYNFVNDHVKEDRGAGRATAVLIEGKGNRLALFLALMDAAGVEYDYLRCGFKPGYLASPPNWTNISAELLPNALVRIRPAEGEEVLLSFDSRLTPFGEIPPYMYGAPALKITGKPERIETLPGGDPSGWTEELTEMAIRVNDHGAAVKGSFSLPGFSRIGFRENLERMDSHTRRRLFEYQILRGVYPGATVKSLEVLGIESDEVPPTFAFELEAEEFIHPVAGKEGCKLLPVPMTLTRAFIRKPERAFPMLQRGYSTHRLVMDIDLNGQYDVLELPESMVERRFFLNYSLVVSKTAKGFRVERTAEFQPADVAPERYPELIEMLKAIDEREIMPIVLQRTGAPVVEEKPEEKEAPPAETAKEPTEK